MIELLVTIMVVLVIMALALSIPQGDRRRVYVMQAAQELAQTFRQARALAIERQAPVAITFNIANRAGTSGKVLNNWSGGHWYRLVSSYQMVAGPGSEIFLGRHGLPEGGLARQSNKLLRNWGGDTDTPASTAVDRVRSCYLGDRVTLPAKQVRFLALTDQDNGGAQYVDPENPNSLVSAWGPGYPRPWFGAWDPSGRRLRGWGAYDHDVKLETLGWQGKARNPGGEAISPTAFWYEGHDGEISGSSHPRDRWLPSDVQGEDGVFRLTTGDSRIPQDVPFTFGNRFFAAGDPRPLVNGDWMDCTLEFWPDGSVRQGVFQSMRLAYSTGADWCSAFWFQPDITDAQRPSGMPPTAGPPWDLTHLGPGDMCAAQMAGHWIRAYPNHVPRHGSWLDRDRCDSSLWASSASSYVDRTGWYWITLGPDAVSDTDVFASAEEARRSLMPAVRVGVNRYGEVRIVPVSVRIPEDVSAGYDLDADLAGDKWDDTVYVQARYRHNMRTDTAGAPLGVPAQEFLTTDMIERRSWWLIPR